MNRKNRLSGMYIVLGLLVASLVVISYFFQLGIMIVMFCVGYGLREALEGSVKE